MTEASNYPLFVDPYVEVLSTDAALDRVIDHFQKDGLELYEAQEQAILELFADHNVVLNTPTGSGKSLVAKALHFFALSKARKSFYISPIKALVNEKFIDLCKSFGPEQVGLITGDAVVNRDAQIICCTAEILANISLREGADADIHDVVIDEFHYYADRDRGIAWQLPLLCLPQARFLLMSATMGDTDFFEKRLTELTGRPTVTVASNQRPVPLEFTYAEKPLVETVEDLLSAGRSPVYIVNFTQSDAVSHAQALLSMNFTSKEEKAKLAEEVAKTEFRSPFGNDMKRFLKHGIGVHHAGLLPKYRILVERLAQQGLLKIISGTDTLGVGVNIPIKTVVFTQLCKFDGAKSTRLAVRDFHQIAGRAGRKGFDDQGYVVAQAPAHVVENLKLDRKAALNPKQKKKIVKAKPPTKGYVHWDQEIFERLVESRCENLQSSFKVNHGMVLQVLGRSDSDGCSDLKSLIRSSHESDAKKRQHRRTAMQLFRSLVEHKIVEIIPKDQRENSKVRVNIDLQENFSMTQSMSLLLLEMLNKLDPTTDDYAVRVLSLVESIIENPQLILRRQLDRIKREALVQMKDAGMDYEDRTDELDKLEYPKPDSDFIYESFNRFREKQPWLVDENIRPKSIAREMYELYHSFNEYIKLYGLEKTEGLLLRYLSNVYHVLTQTVPEDLKNDNVDDVIVYIRNMLKTVDSSLVDEWHRIKSPLHEPAAADTPAKAESIIDDKRLFKKMVQSAILSFVRQLAAESYDNDDAIVVISDDDLRELREFRDSYCAEHGQILTNHAARLPHNTRFHELGTDWTVTQNLVDEHESGTGFLTFEVDVRKSAEQEVPAISFRGFGGD